MDDTAEEFSFRRSSTAGVFTDLKEGNANLEKSLLAYIIQYPAWDVFVGHITAVLSAVPSWEEELCSSAMYSRNGRLYEHPWTRSISTYQGCKFALHGGWRINGAAAVAIPAQQWPLFDERSYLLYVHTGGDILHIVFGSDKGGRCTITGKLPQVLKVLSLCNVD